VFLFLPLFLILLNHSTCKNVHFFGKYFSTLLFLFKNFMHTICCFILFDFTLFLFLAFLKRSSLIWMTHFCCCSSFNACDAVGKDGVFQGLFFFKLLPKFNCKKCMCITGATSSIPRQSAVHYVKIIPEL